MENRKKLVVVGDQRCGKTSLLVVYRKDEFPETNVPTVCENYNSNLELDDGQRLELELWDSVDQSDYAGLRQKSYVDADVIVMCFAVDSPNSLYNTVKNWLDEVNPLCPKVPIILVGNKKDLRNDPKIIEDLQKVNQTPVTQQIGQTAAQYINAVAYLECSAKSREGVREVFAAAARATLKPKKKWKDKCSIL